MGQVLGLGVTHGPYVVNLEESMNGIVRGRLRSPTLPAALKDPSNWPEPMRLEWGDDEGLASARHHRARLVEGFRKVRAMLDEFKPDVVVIWGDDQHENFLEDVVPAFCVFAQDQYSTHPFASGRGPVPNHWGESDEWELRIPGQRQIAKELANSLLNDKFDVAWAYKQLHRDMAHAFWRTIVHLDVDRQGWGYPIIPFHVNCYGRRFSAGGSAANDSFEKPEFDPPSPTPERCFELGAAVARFFKQSPYRAALIGSSSWSHAFLTEKHNFLWPDVESDRQRFAELSDSNLKAWKQIPLSQIEDSGQHEMLNWMCLAGAADELNLKPRHLEFVESWIFNSCKVFAAFGE